jgi:flavin reductase (DIM6/NTAB) family NADH-FMN oxidoreductase RutF
VTDSLAERAAGPTSTDFRGLMAEFPTGVAVLTAFGPDGRPHGMTCSSVCSVTLSPPTLLVCVRSGSPTLAAIVAGSRFAVNLLHDRASETARLFASGDPDRFSRVRWDAGPEAAGPHLADDALAVAHCAVARTEPVGDHVVVFGEVRRIVREPGRDPLLYGQRRFAAWPAG